MPRFREVAKNSCGDRPRGLLRLSPVELLSPLMRGSADFGKRLRREMPAGCLTQGTLCAVASEPNNKVIAKRPPTKVTAAGALQFF